MSDFDTVLERLLSDEGFKAALAADPGRALAGYQLAPDEVELLQAQVSTDSGGEREVEQRTSKASIFGLLSSLGGAGLGRAGDPALHAGQGGAHAAAGSVQAGSASADASNSVHAGFGAAGQASLGEAGWQDFPAGSGGTGEAAPGMADGAGAVHSGGTFGRVGEQLSAPTDQGQGSMQAAPPPPPAGYHPHIDVNGDGRWDAYTVQGRADGGVDLVADMDHDGRADFIGHDLNRDGLVESADYDKDHDGVFENHQFDVNGDGWLDKTVVDPKPSPSIPQSVAEELRFGNAG